jgi:hypothetical protein
MIYIIAVLISLIVTGQSLTSEILAGNIRHLKNGRQPNAGATLFPAIPFFQFLVVGLAWLLQTFIPQYSILVLIGFFLVFFGIWLLDFYKLKADFMKRLDSN